MSSQVSFQEIDKIMVYKNGLFYPIKTISEIDIALNEYTRYIFRSSPNCMMSSSVAMEILCISNIGSISSKKIAGVEKMM